MFLSFVGATFTDSPSLFNQASRRLKEPHSLSFCGQERLKLPDLSLSDWGRL